MDRLSTLETGDIAYDPYAALPIPPLCSLHLSTFGGHLKCCFRWSGDLL